MIVIYEYKALDKDGQSVRGRLEAIDQPTAFIALQNRGLSPVSIKVSGASQKFFRFRSLKKKDLIRTVKQLSILISAGVPILEAVESLARSNSHELLTEKLKEVSKLLRSGGKLGQAVEVHLPMLPDYVVRFVELGESTGRLGEALSEAVEQLENEEKIANDIRTAMSYPVFLAVVGGAVIVGMFLFVVPRFAELLENSSGDLPAISIWVIQFSLWFKANFITIFFAMLACSILSAFVLKGQKKLVGSVLGNTPIVSNFMMVGEMAVWCRTIGGCLMHGADLLPSLELAERGIKMDGLKRNLAKVRKAVRAGKSLDLALSESVDKIDPMIIDMLRTGRATGALGPLLLSVASVYDEEVSQRTKRITSLAEPMAILVISLVVGTIVLSIVMAMTSMYEVDL